MSTELNVRPYKTFNGRDSLDIEAREGGVVCFEAHDDSFGIVFPTSLDAADAWTKLAVLLPDSGKVGEIWECSDSLRIETAENAFTWTEEGLANAGREVGFGLSAFDPQFIHEALVRSGVPDLRKHASEIVRIALPVVGSYGNPAVSGLNS
jgi:sucrose-6-phosphate hydrolase SacC (GH32 family)